MAGLFGGSKSSSTSTPVDLTPDVFKNLQPDVANALRALFQGGGPVFTGSNNLGTSTPTIANPALTQLQRQVADLQAQIDAGNKTITTPGTPPRVRPGVDLGPAGTPGPVTTTVKTPAQIKALQAKLAAAQAALSKAPQTIANPGFRPATQASVEAGTNPLVAPLTGGQNQLVNRATQMGLNPDGSVRAAQGQLTDTLGGKFLDPAANPFLQGTIDAAQRPVIQAFQDVAVPELLSRFTAAGQQVQGSGSSAFASEGRKLTTSLMQNLGDISSRIAGENFQNERNRQIEAASRASQISTEQVNNVLSSLQAASLPQLVKDLGIQRGIEQFNKRVDNLIKALTLATQATQPTVANSGTSTDKTKPNILGTIISGFGTAFPAGI